MFSNEQLVNNPNLVLRWIQFGVFTPIFRTHATNDSRIERRIWKFDNFPTILEAVRLRYSLFPYIYTMARKTYDTGISICRPLYYEYPDVEEAYTYDNEYFFGDDILVAPITEAPKEGATKTQKTIWFPEGKWWSVSTNELIEGPCKKTMQFTDAQIPYFFRQGAIIPYNPATVMNVTERPDKLILNVVAGSNGEGSIYEDDGDNADYVSNSAVTTLTQTVSGNEATVTVSARNGFAAKAPQKRAYEVRVCNSRKPLSVSVDGKQTPFTFDAATKTTTIEAATDDCSKARVIKVSFDSATAVDNISSNSSKVGYNAATKCLVGSFASTCKDVSMLVSNGMGKTMLSGTYHNVSGFSADMSMLQPQLYISKVMADGETFVTKFVKE